MPCPKLQRRILVIEAPEFSIKNIKQRGKKASSTEIMLAAAGVGFGTEI